MTASRILALVFAIASAGPVAGSPPIQPLRDSAGSPPQVPAARKAGEIGSSVATINGTTMRPRTAAGTINGATIHLQSDSPAINGATLQRPKS